MHHIVYKTTQKSTGKWYIGKHSTRNLEDGYMGSGIDISAAIKKNPEDFEREVLGEFNTSAEAFAEEARLMSPTVLVENYDNVFNKIPGGRLTRKSIMAWARWRPGNRIPRTTYMSPRANTATNSITFNFFNKYENQDYYNLTIKHSNKVAIVQSVIGNSIEDLTRLVTTKNRKFYKSIRSNAKDNGIGLYFAAMLSNREYMYAYIPQSWNNVILTVKKGKKYVTKNVKLQQNLYTPWMYSASIDDKEYVESEVVHTLLEDDNCTLDDIREAYYKLVKENSILSKENNRLMSLVQELDRKRKYNAKSALKYRELYKASK